MESSKVTNHTIKIYEECKFSGDGFSFGHELGECSIAFQIIPLVKREFHELIISFGICSSVCMPSI